VAACESTGLRLHHGKGEQMIPLLLWILGVPGLIIILLLLLGIIKL
jgi:hypothetical protein